MFQKKKKKSIQGAVVNAVPLDVEFLILYLQEHSSVSVFIR